MSNKCSTMLGRLWLMPIVAAAQFVTDAALAWDGSEYGYVSGVEATDGNNYGFRVYLNGVPLCSNANTWAYLNEGDSNYKAYVAILMAAKTMGTPVRIFTNRDSQGYCHIGYLWAG